MPSRSVGPCAVTWPGRRKRIRRLDPGVARPVHEARPHVARTDAAVDLFELGQVVLDALRAPLAALVRGRPSGEARQAPRPRPAARRSRATSCCTGPSLSSSGASSARRQNVPLTPIRHLTLVPICGARPGGSTGSIAILFQTGGGAVRIDVIGLEHLAAGERDAHAAIGDGDGAARASASARAPRQSRRPASWPAAGCRPCSDRPRIRSSTSRGRRPSPSPGSPGSSATR